MNRKKIALLLVLLEAILFTASCTFRSHYEVEDANATSTAVFLTQEIEDQKATITALVAMLTPRPTVTLTPSPTPICLVWTPSGVCALNPDIRRTPEGDLGSPPSDSDVVGEIPANCSGLWRCYYDEKGAVLGQVRRDFSWEKDGDYYVLTGWTPKEYLAFEDEDEAGTTESCPHVWGHYRGRRLRHTHFFDSQSRVLATIPEGMRFTTTGEVSTLSVPNCQGEIVPTEGVIITLVERVKIP